MKQFDLIRKKWMFINFSGVLVLISLIAVCAFGFRTGIDLNGGTEWRIAFKSGNISTETVRSALENVAPGLDVSIKQSSDGTFTLRMPDIGESQHQTYLTALRSLGDLNEDFANISPVIGKELQKKSLWAMLTVILGISLYIAWAFRKVSAPVKSWKYGIVTLVSLFHDVSIPAGFIAILGKLKGVEIDTNFIVALLVVMGFSVHDTIVVFDRIRENLLLKRGSKVDLGAIVNFSVNETFVRSVNTSLTLILVLIAMLFFGPPSLFYFILTMLVGTVFGTYSSIFVASPLLYLWGKPVSSGK